MTYKAQFKKSIKKLFRWTISTSFDNFPDIMISKQDLQKYISEVWDEMCEDGDIEIFV